jgi:hypothetical protein
LEHLYALSRVSDLLLVPFEPVWPALLGDASGDGVPWQPDVAVTEQELRAWWQALGMSPISEARPFHPFYYEIVAVEQAEDPAEPISVTATIWNGFLLGQMLFSRAGVVVRGGREHIVKEIAETSQLYWTYWRNNRHAEDRSHGWGHNSQWSTDFRRDYVTAEAYHYNVDGNTPLVDAQGQVDTTALTDELSARGAIEIMTHRCLVTQREGFWHVDLDGYSHREPRTPTPVGAHHNHG